MVGLVPKVPGYELEGRNSTPGSGRNFCLRHRVQTGLGAHPVSYPMGTGGFLPEDKEAGA